MVPNEKGETRGKRNTTRGARGRFMRTADTAARDAAVCEMRTAGLSFRVISEKLGCSDEEARVGYKRALQSIVQEPAEDARKLELERLDALWMQAWAVMERTHPLVQGGKVVTVVVGDAETGVEQGLEDDGPVLQAIDRLMKIAARKAALLGLDAPTKIVTDGQVRYVVDGVDMDKLR